LIKLNRLMKL